MVAQKNDKVRVSDHSESRANHILDYFDTFCIILSRFDNCEAVWFSWVPGIQSVCGISHQGSYSGFSGSVTLAGESICARFQTNSARIPQNAEKWSFLNFGLSLFQTETAEVPV